MSQLSDEFLARHPELLDEDQRSERWLRWNSRLAWPHERYFRFRIHDIERIPHGPCIVVANHSAGSPFVIPLLHRAWWLARPHEPMRGLVHRLVWQPPVRWFPALPKLGGILAHPRVAARALERGEAVFVFPGGEFDAMRPFWERERPNFGGRTGFVALARAQRVPLVPLAIAGSHAVYVMLPGAHLISRLIGGRDLVGLRALPLTLGMVITFATLLASAFWPGLLPLAGVFFVLAAWPAPSRIEGQVLEPVTVTEGESDAEIAEKIVARLAEALERLSAKRKTPWG